MISVSLSSGEGTLEMSKDEYSVSSVNNRKRSFDTFGNEIETENSLDQNCLSIDSHMSQFRIPKHMRNTNKLPFHELVSARTSRS